MASWRIGDVVKFKHPFQYEAIFIIISLQSKAINSAVLLPKQEADLKQIGVLENIPLELLERLS